VVLLQIGLVAVLGFVAGFAFWTSDFSHDMIRNQLAAQQIFFPPAGSEALNPEEYPDLQKYAGQQVLNGEQAKAYADHYIGHHLQGIADGQTYSQVSSASRENPEDEELAAQTQTLFRGETLRGLLLNAYGWWTIGQYAFYAAIGLTVAAAIVFCALIFELVLWRLAVRREADAGAPVASAAARQPAHPA
jgi:hypothetical protein